MNGGLGRNHIRIERKGPKDVFDLRCLFVPARQGKTRNTRVFWTGRALRVSDLVRSVIWPQRIDILMISIPKVHYELNRIEVDTNRMVRFIAQKDLHRKDSYLNRICLAEFLSSARGFVIGIGQNRHT